MISSVYEASCVSTPPAGGGLAPAHPLGELARCLAHGVPGHVRPARRPRALIDGRALAVDREHLDRSYGEAELLRRDLREDRALARAGVGAAEPHARVPVRVEVDRGHARVRTGYRVRAAAVHRGRDADAAALLLGALLLIPRDRLADRDEAVVEPRGHEAGAAQHRRAGLVRVAQPELERIDAGLLGELVDRALLRERGLRAAVAAELAAGSERRVDEARVPRRAVRHVDRAERLHADVHDRRAEVVVRAVVDVDARLEQADPSRAIGTRLEAHAEGMARLRGGELLLARERDLHGPPARAGERGRKGLVLGHLRLRAESSTDGDLAADDLLAFQTEDMRELVHDEVRRLRRRPQLEPFALRIPAGDADVLLHHRMCDARVPVGPARRKRAFTSTELNVSPRALVVERDVRLAVRAVVQVRRVRRERLVERERSRQAPVRTSIAASARSACSSVSAATAATSSPT